MTINQISVFLENRAGQLSEITQVLAQNNIDLRAINIAETSDYGVLRLIVDRPHEASAILLEHGFILSMTPVLVVTVPDQPGGLAHVLLLMANNNIDIDYMYSAFGLTNKEAYMVFRVANPQQLYDLLVANGVTVAGEAMSLN